MQGLIWCGSTLSSNYSYLDDAKKAYRLALEKNQACGFVERTLRIFDELALADEKISLDEVRAIKAP